MDSTKNNQNKSSMPLAYNFKSQNILRNINIQQNDKLKRTQWILNLERIRKIKNMFKITKLISLISNVKESKCEFIYKITSAFPLI